MPHSSFSVEQFKSNSLTVSNPTSINGTWCNEDVKRDEIITCTRDKFYEAFQPTTDIIRQTRSFPSARISQLITYICNLSIRFFLITATCQIYRGSTTISLNIGVKRRWVTIVCLVRESKVQISFCSLLLFLLLILICNTVTTHLCLLCCCCVMGVGTRLPSGYHLLVCHFLYKQDEIACQVIRNEALEGSVAVKVDRKIISLAAKDINALSSLTNKLAPRTNYYNQHSHILTRLVFSFQRKQQRSCIKNQVSSARGS